MDTPSLPSLHDGNSLDGSGAVVMEECSAADAIRTNRPIESTVHIATRSVARARASQCNGRTLVESWQTGVEWKHLAD